MTTALIVLAGLAALDPFRGASASPAAERGRAGATAAAVVLVAVAASALVSGPLLDAVSVTGSSARIAAGVALTAVSLRDLFASPPGAEPGRVGVAAGLFPLAFPVVFTPAVALVAMAAAADRGVVVAVAGFLPGLALVAAAIARPTGRMVTPGLRTVAGAGTAVGAFVVLDGVYAI